MTVSMWLALRFASRRAWTIAWYDFKCEMAEERIWARFPWLRPQEPA